MRIGRLLGASMLLLTAACATDSHNLNSPLAPGQRPALRSTEAGFWYQMDKFEKRLGNSALVNRDPDLNAYLRSVICRLEADHCSAIKLFVLKHPYFNATMAPNGSMHVWTGLLLRVENEDQLATVLGHELAHYLHRHGIKKYNSVKATTDFLTFFAIATGGVGFGFVGLAASIGAAGSLTAYSRDLETEADREGLILMHRAGYNSAEAARLWRQIKAEKDASKEEKKSVFWATHPPTEQRIAALEKQNKLFDQTASKQETAVPSEFKQIVDRYWHQWMEELISTQAFEEALVVVDQLENRGFNGYELAYFRGEILRRRSAEGDLKDAAIYYDKAAGQNPAPLKTHKQRGLVAKRLGQKEQAITYFETYLVQNPDAGDSALVRSYIEQLRK